MNACAPRHHFGAIHHAAFKSAPPCEDLKALGRRLADVSDTEFRALADVALALLREPSTQPNYDAAIVLDVEAAFEERFGTLAYRALEDDCAWNEQDQGFVEWAADACETWGRIAADYAGHELAALGRSSPSSHRLLVTAMARFGDAAVWRAIAGHTRHDLAPLHATWLLAGQKGMAGEAAMVVADGISIHATPEALYVRALLVDALCSGHFGRRISRQVSRWLLAWCAIPRVRRAPAGGSAPVVIDVNGGTGLHLGSYFSGPAAQYLEGLERLAVSVADARDHADQDTVTAFDGATRAEREAGLARLSSLLDYWTGRAGDRAARVAPSQDTVVPCAVGLREIVEALEVEEAAAGGSFGPAGRADGSGDPVRRDSRGMGFAIDRVARVIDVSDTGIGLALEREGDRLPAPGDLLGLRIGSRMHVGEVVRCSVHPVRRRAVVGVKLLSKEARPVRLAALGEDVPRYARNASGLLLSASPLLDCHEAVVIRSTTFVATPRHLLRHGDAPPRPVRLAQPLRAGNGWAVMSVEDAPIR